MGNSHVSAGRYLETLTPAPGRDIILERDSKKPKEILINELSKKKSAKTLDDSCSINSASSMSKNFDTPNKASRVSGLKMNVRNIYITK